MLSLSLDSYIAQRVLRQEEQEQKEALLRARLINLYEEFRSNPSHSDPYPSGTVLTLELELYLKRTCNHIDYFIDVLFPCASFLLLMIMALLTIIVILLCLLRKDYSDYKCSAPCASRHRLRYLNSNCNVADCKTNSDGQGLRNYELGSKAICVRVPTDLINVKKRKV